MPLETRTLPGTILREKGGEQLASGWCIIAYETAVKYEPLEEWRGEIAIADAGARSTLGELAGQVLYLQCKPYGGEFESWHGPVLVELIDSEHDPYERRVRLRAAGQLIRSERAIPGTDWNPPYNRMPEDSDDTGPYPAAYGASDQREAE